MIYFLLVDRFANGDVGNDGAIELADPQSFHGGDLAGVVEHLPELRRMGVDTLWLGPIAKMRDTPFGGHGAFHGYWTENLAELEPRFGTPDDLARLGTAADAAGIGLVLDLVYNHLAPDHAWVTERPGWFHDTGGIRNWDDPVEVVTYRVHGLPDLAQEKAEVYDWLLSSTLVWLRGVRPLALRLDAVRHMDPAFLRRIGDELRAQAPNLELWGEVFDGNVRTVANSRRDAGLDVVFDFPLHYALRDVVCDGGVAAAIPAVLDRTRQDPDSAWITFLDNHDTPRITTACHAAGRRVDTALDLLFALRGRPMITWGTEWGARGGGEPDNRADMKWTWSSPAEQVGHLQRVSRLTALARARRESAALREGTSRTLALGADWFIIERESGADRRWVVYNGKASPLTGAWPEPVPPGSARVFDANALGLRAKPVPSGWTLLRATGLPPLRPGEEVRLVGGCEVLGDWRPEAGVVVPGRVRLDDTAKTFKLVIVSADGGVTWSPGANQWKLGGGGTLTVSWS